MINPFTFIAYVVVGLVGTYIFFRIASMAVFRSFAEIIERIHCSNCYFYQTCKEAEGNGEEKIEKEVRCQG